MFNILLWVLRFSTSLIRNQTHRWYGAGAAVLFDFMLDITSKQPLSFRRAIQSFHSALKSKKTRQFREAILFDWKAKIIIFWIFFKHQSGTEGTLARDFEIIMQPLLPQKLGSIESNLCILDSIFWQTSFCPKTEVYFF